MLQHPEDTFSPGSLARDTELNPAAVSRIVTALEEAAVIRKSDPRPRRGRERRVQLTRSLALLEAWLPAWQRRRITRDTWDIGARDADDAISRIVAIAYRHDFAVGGLAGAALVSRVVEPATITLWASPAGVDRLSSALDPVGSRAGRGTLEIAVAPDPWTLGLARPNHDGVPIADPAQLWLDCVSEGERALEAADAIAQGMSWS